MPHIRSDLCASCYTIKKSARVLLTTRANFAQYAQSILLVLVLTCFAMRIKMANRNGEPQNVFFSIEAVEKICEQHSPLAVDRLTANRPWIAIFLTSIMSPCYSPWHSVKKIMPHRMA